MRLHLDRIGYVGNDRDARKLGGQLGGVDLDVVGHVAFGQSLRLQHQIHLLRLFLDLHHVADLDPVARDVHPLAVHLDVTVVDELARGENGGHKFGAIDDGVEPALQQADHVGAAIALHADRFAIDAAELLFGNIAVITAQLLLGLELHAVVGELALAALAVLAGAVFAPVHRAFGTSPASTASAARASSPT